MLCSFKFIIYYWFWPKQWIDFLIFNPNAGCSLLGHFIGLFLIFKLSCWVIINAGIFYSSQLLDWAFHTHTHTHTLINYILCHFRKLQKYCHLSGRKIVGDYKEKTEKRNKLSTYWWSCWRTSFGRWTMLMEKERPTRTPSDKWGEGRCGIDLVKGS